MVGALSGIAKIKNMTLISMETERFHTSKEGDKLSIYCICNIFHITL
ncbi:hypothetical protein NYQ66_09645 [Aquibacillus koreensis]|nr:hypothetical protein [Aquibacillus koreensis]